MAEQPWLSVPYVEQVRAGCGSAAVTMVMQYWAQQMPALRLAAPDTGRLDTLLPANANGIKGADLKRFLEKNGFDAFVFDGEMSDLEHHFEKGRPVIVCLAPRGSRGPLHYAVVVGVNKETVWLNDSARGKLFTEDRERFRKEWDGTAHWALLAVPRFGH
jgi:predicted double-glycine peptidase